MTDSSASKKRYCTHCGEPLVQGKSSHFCPACMFDFPTDDESSPDINHAASTVLSTQDEDENPPEFITPSSEANGESPKKAKTTILGQELPPFDEPPRTPPPRRLGTGRMRYGRWVVAIVFVVLAAGAIARLMWIETQTREPVDLTPLILAEGYSVEFVVGAVEGIVPEKSDLLWYAVREFPAIVQAADGQLEFAREQEGSRDFEGLPITRINGIAVEDLQIEETLEDVRSDTRLRVTLVEDGDTREVVYRRVVMASQWARLLAGLSFGALGVVAFWLRPGRKSSMGFLVACAYIALFWYTRSVQFYFRVDIEDFTYHVLQCFLPIPFVVFMATFTPLRRVVGQPLYAAGAAAIPSTILILTNLVLYPTAALHGYLDSPAYKDWAVLMIATILLTVPFGLWCRIRGVKLSPTDISRGRIVCIAVLLSFAPLIVFAYLDYRSDLAHSYNIIPELVVILFPVVILYAIARHNLLRISELLREGLIYGFLSLGLLSLYAAVTAGVTTLFADIGDSYIRGVVVAGTVLVAIPSHNAVRQLIRRRLDIPPEAYDDLLQKLDEISKGAPSPDGYCRDVVRLFERIAKTDHVAILVREPGELDWKISDSQRGPAFTPIEQECLPLIDELESQKSEVFLDDYLDDLSVVNHQTTPLQSLVALNANVVMPMSARDQIVGALALGSRVDQRNHSARELKLYRRMAAHIAGTLVQMFDRLRAASGDRIVDIYPDYPKRIGNFVIERVLGEGGMSYVYLGQNSLGFAALKVCNRFVQSDRQLLERFHREGVAMSRIKHPNIVPILDVGWEGPEPYIALEYFGRGSLDDIVETKGPCSEATALRYLTGAVRGLEAALKADIIHRDIKPTNLFVADDDTIKIGDFGLARLADQSTLTREGEIFGTPHFMSPEILRGNTADWTADQYALGVSLFYALTGQMPFEGENVESLHYQHVNAPVPEVRSLRPNLSEACSEIISRMVAKRMEDRFESYAQIEATVENILSKKK